MSASLPPISSIPTLPASEHARVLDLLFEPCPSLLPVARPVLTSHTFDTYPALVHAIRKELDLLAASASASTADTDTESHASILNAILCAHPRLGETNVESAQSRGEQAQLHEGDGGEAEELRRLNAEYEAQFPGLRYVVFVNGRSRPEVMENMRARIARGDIVSERAAAVQAMCDIAVDRARTLES